MKKLPNDCVGSMKFMPPSRILVGGSYSLDTILNAESSIDIFVEMPENLFHKIDSKNYRYMRKKAIYLAIIAANVNEELAESKFFVGNSFNPRLKIVPSGSLNKKFVIYVHVVVQERTFLVNRFTAEKNNVRAGWFFGDKEKQLGKICLF